MLPLKVYLIKPANLYPLLFSISEFDQITAASGGKPSSLRVSQSFANVFQLSQGHNHNKRSRILSKCLFFL